MAKIWAYLISIGEKMIEDCPTSLLVKVKALLGVVDDGK